MVLDISLKNNNFSLPDYMKNPEEINKFFIQIVSRTPPQHIVRHCSSN